MKPRRRQELRVSPKKLYRRCNLKNLDFQKTSEVKPITSFIGQEKATKALQFGLEIEAPGYNIFVTGIPNTGRTSLIQRYLHKFVRQRKIPANFKDLCYVYNFDDPSKPKLLVLEKGGGERLKIDIEGILKFLQAEIPNIDQSKEFREAKDQIEAEFEKAFDLLDEELDYQIKENKLCRLETNTGFKFVPMSPTKENQPMTSEESQNLSPEERKDSEKRVQNVQKLIEEQNLIIDRLRQMTADKIRAVKEGLIKTRCFQSIFDYLNSYQNTAIQEYLKGLTDWVIRNLDLFAPQKKTLPFMGLSLPSQDYQNDKFIPFQVNVIVDNSKQDLPPIILENHPTFTNLFGKIGKQFIQGVYVTDHTMVKPGSLLLANNGYLIIDILDLLRNAGVWPKLKKILTTGFLKIEDIYEYLGYHSVTIEPDSIPISVKVIVICDPTIYHLLSAYDSDFLDVFKVRVEFNDRMDLSRINFQNYARFISFCCQNEGLMPFEKDAVAKVIEYGIRLVDDQKKLSAQFGKIKDLIIEANYWAKKVDADSVKAVHVQKAIEAQKKRTNLYEEERQEAINRGVILIDTQGERVGQINGLVVYDEHCFGCPVKITVQVFAGEEGIVSIQRDVGLSGPIYDTGVMILSAYLSAKYAQDRALSLSASICLEQNYGGIEGDSATAAESMALLSSLANVPIDQSLAVTGSMNQKGEIQPVGGVNEKIEGFFDICRKNGLTGEQGVIIPIQNLDNLMLKEDVVKAVKKGHFHIYAVKTIDEVIELTTNRPASEVHKLIQKRLLRGIGFIKKIKKLIKRVHP